MIVSRTPQLSVNRSDVDATVVLQVKGEIDIASVPTLRAVLDGVFAAAAVDVCIDLSPTTFMDSSGVHFLFETLRRAESVGRRLTVIAPEGNVRRVLRISGAESELPLRDGA
jgi:anti-sigma B factor antagonist